MSLETVCKLYIEGQSMHDEARKLSQKSLAKEHRLCERTVNRIANFKPCTTPAKKQAEIRKAVARRDKLKSQAAELTLPRLCKKYGVGYDEAVSALERMNAWRATA